eukprot:g4565.t1
MWTDPAPPSTGADAGDAASDGDYTQELPPRRRRTDEAASSKIVGQRPMNDRNQPSSSLASSPAETPEAPPCPAVHKSRSARETAEAKAEFETTLRAEENLWVEDAAEPSPRGGDAVSTAALVLPTSTPAELDPKLREWMRKVYFDYVAVTAKKSWMKEVIRKPRHPGIRLQGELPVPMKQPDNDGTAIEAKHISHGSWLKNGCFLVQGARGTGACIVDPKDVKQLYYAIAKLYLLNRAPLLFENPSPLFKLFFECSFVLRSEADGNVTRRDLELAAARNTFYKQFFLACRVSSRDEYRLEALHASGTKAEEQGRSDEVDLVEENLVDGEQAFKFSAKEKKRTMAPGVVPTLIWKTVRKCFPEPCGHKGFKMYVGAAVTPMQHIRKTQTHRIIVRYLFPSLLVEPNTATAVRKEVVKELNRSAAQGMRELRVALDQEVFAPMDLISRSPEDCGRFMDRLLAPDEIYVPRNTALRGYEVPIRAGRWNSVPRVALCHCATNSEGFGGEILRWRSIVKRDKDEARELPVWQAVDVDKMVDKNTSCLQDAVAKGDYESETAAREDARLGNLMQEAEYLSVRVDDYKNKKPSQAEPRFMQAVRLERRVRTLRGSK